MYTGSVLHAFILEGGVLKTSNLKDKSAGSLGCLSRKPVPLPSLARLAPVHWASVTPETSLYLTTFRFVGQPPSQRQWDCEGLQTPC